MLLASSLPSLCDVGEAQSPASEVAAAALVASRRSRSVARPEIGCNAAALQPMPLGPARKQMSRKEKFEPAPSLLERCDRSDDVFRRFGWAGSKKRTAGVVLQKMQRPTKKCSGLNVDVWQAGVERLRAAEAHRKGSLDARPVPSWNFRYGGKGKLGGDEVYLGDGGAPAHAGGRQGSNQSATAPPGAVARGRQHSKASARCRKGSKASASSSSAAAVEAHAEEKDCGLSSGTGHTIEAATSSLLV